MVIMNHKYFESYTMLAVYLLMEKLVAIQTLGSSGNPFALSNPSQVSKVPTAIILQDITQGKILKCSNFRDTEN